MPCPGTIVLPDFEPASGGGGALSEHKYRHMYNRRLALCDGTIEKWFCDCHNGQKTLRTFEGDLSKTTQETALTNLQQCGNCVHVRYSQTQTTPKHITH
jgi:hypothetical protein